MLLLWVGLYIWHLHLSVQLSHMLNGHQKFAFPSSWCAGTSQFLLPPCSLSDILPLIFSHTLLLCRCCQAIFPSGGMPGTAIPWAS